MLKIGSGTEDIRVDREAQAVGEVTLMRLLNDDHVAKFELPLAPFG